MTAARSPGPGRRGCRPAAARPPRRGGACSEGRRAARGAGQRCGAGAVRGGEGTTNLGGTGRDAGGNSASANLVVVRDTTAPAVAISQPPAGAVVGTAEVDVVGSASDLHLASVTVNGT